MVKSKTACLIVACSVTAFAAAILLNGGKTYVSATAQSEMRTQLPPVKATQNRDAYFPGTEDLGPNEMRVISLGTAMPFQRPTQAAPSFLVELGIGDKFLFDIGTG